MKTFCISGCAGFIGFNLARKLLERGDIVIGIDDFDNSLNPESEDVYYEDHWVRLRKYANFIPLKMDINHVSKSIIQYIFKKEDMGQDILPDKIQIDGVFHLAALARIQRAISEPEKATKSNVNGMLRMLELCRELKIPRLVFSSSSNVYGEQEGIHTEEKCPNPQNPYAYHKLIGEHFCEFYHKQYGINTVMLRYFNVTGPEQNPKGEYALLVPNFCLKALKGEDLPLYGNGSKTRAFVNVSDVVNANILAMETMNIDCFGEAFNICGEKSYSIQEITNKILALTNSKSKIKYLPDKPGETLQVVTNSKKAEELLGWKPQKNIDETLKECVDFFRRKYIEVENE